MGNNLSGKVIVLTGATSGMGLETAKVLVSYGAYVIGVGRSESKCSEAKKIILSDCHNGCVDFLAADLSLQKQIAILVQKIKELLTSKGFDQIDVLINDAGTFSNWYISTEEGFELQFAVNHIAPFLLANKLMPLLKKADEARIITISSGSHYRTRLKWKDIQLRRHYNCLYAYKQTKLENVLFTHEINRRLGENSSVRAYAVDPGLVNTEIGLKNTTGIAHLIWKMRRQHGVAPEKGAATCIYLASEKSAGGRRETYWKDCIPKKPSLYSMNIEAGIKLWKLSEKMCGINSAEYGIGPG